MDFNIICFQHCEKYVYCKKVPETCPICNKCLLDEQFKIIPFRYPNPFKNAVEYPCSVVMKPTNGDFINNYNTSDDLHIGVTKADGTIVEFEENGLIISKSSKWNRCLILYQAEECWMDHWETILDQLCNTNYWTSKYYNETTNNCYTFVLSFLNQLNFGKLSHCAKDKHLFCEEIIIPQTTIAGRYIIICRQLRSKDYLIGNI